jgi:hypothetical protein
MDIQTEKSHETERQPRTTALSWKGLHAPMTQRAMLVYA